MCIRDSAADRPRGRTAFFTRSLEMTECPLVTTAVNSKYKVKLPLYADPVCNPDKLDQFAAVLLIEATSADQVKSVIFNFHGLGIRDVKVLPLGGNFCDGLYLMSVSYTHLR